MEDPQEVSASSWNEQVSQSVMLTVVYFWHDQCAWCLRLTPVFNEIAREYSGKIKFVKINVLKDPSNKEIAGNFGIMSTPTLMFMCKGRPLGQIVGLQPKDALEKAMNDMLLRHRQCLGQSTELRPSYIV